MFLKFHCPIEVNSFIKQFTRALGEIFIITLASFLKQQTFSKVHDYFVCSFKCKIFSYSQVPNKRGVKINGGWEISEILINGGGSQNYTEE